MLQLLPLILVPFVAVVQSCRYMLYVDSAEVGVKLGLKMPCTIIRSAVA